MKRYFNTEGCCLPDEHYMVKLEERMKRIKESYVDRGKYFVISKGRQYGKTTTLKALENYLSSDYLVSAICKYLDEEVSDTFEFEDAAARQIVEYLDYFHQKKGYLVSFNFNRKKTPGIRTIVLGDKMIVEAVV